MIQTLQNGLIQIASENVNNSMFWISFSYGCWKGVEQAILSANPNANPNRIRIRIRIRIQADPNANPSASPNANPNANPPWRDADVTCIICLMRLSPRGRDQ